MLSTEFPRDPYQELSVLDVNAQRNLVYGWLGYKKVGEILNASTECPVGEKLTALKEKVELFAKERKEEILKFVKQINKFHKKRDRFASTNTNYEIKQQFPEKISLNYLPIKDNNLIEKIGVIGDHAKKAWVKFGESKIQQICVPYGGFFSIVIHAFSEWQFLYETVSRREISYKLFSNMQEARNAKAEQFESVLKELEERKKILSEEIERLEHLAKTLEDAMVCVFHEKGMEYFDEKVECLKLSNFSNDVLKSFNDMVEKAKKFVEDYQKELDEKLAKKQAELKYKQEQAIKNLLDSLVKYEEASKALRSDEKFVTLREEKLALKQTFANLSKFCQKDELRYHLKLTRESSNRILKWNKS